MESVDSSKRGGPGNGGWHNEGVRGFLRRILFQSGFFLSGWGLDANNKWGGGIFSLVFLGEFLWFVVFKMFCQTRFASLWTSPPATRGGTPGEGPCGRSNAGHRLLAKTIAGGARKRMQGRLGFAFVQKSWANFCWGILFLFEVMFYRFPR